MSTASSITFVVSEPDTRTMTTPVAAEPLRPGSPWRSGQRVRRDTEILAVASAPNHFKVVGPIARAFGDCFELVYGGKHPTVRERGKALGGRHISRFAFGFGAFRCRSRAQLLAYACRRALAYFRPAVVLITSGRYHLEQAMVAAAREQKIPSLAFFDGFFKGAGMVREQYDVADLLCVKGERMRSDLIGLGIPAEKIRVLGDPRLEETLWAG